MASIDFTTTQWHQLTTTRNGINWPQPILSSPKNKFIKKIYRLITSPHTHHPPSSPHTPSLSHLPPSSVPRIPVCPWQPSRRPVLPCAEWTRLVLRDWMTVWLRRMKSKHRAAHGERARTFARRPWPSRSDASLSRQGPTWAGTKYISLNETHTQNDINIKYENKKTTTTHKEMNQW